jgi:hypothetical protein
MRAFVICFFLFAISLTAADLTGKWSGSYDVSMADGETMKGKVILVLTQTGSDVTGSVGQNEDEMSKIRKGSVEGDRVTFESQTEGPLMKFELRLENDHLRGEAKGDVDGNPIKVKLDLVKT